MPRRPGLGAILLLPAFLGVAALAAPARAQVTVDLHALDGLPSRPAPEPRPRPVPTTPHTVVRAPLAPHPVARAPAPGARPTEVAATPKPAAQTAVAPPVASAPLPSQAAPSAGGARQGEAAPAPLAPPPAPVLAGNPTVPSAPAAFPPPAPPGAPAPAIPAAAPAAPAHPLTVTFPPDASTLAPADAAAITDLARTTPETDATSFTVLAYAAGSPQNPSAPRRLSLARALAVRAALQAGGVPVGRIYLRAMGAAVGAGPADRAEILVSGSPTPAAGTAR